MNKTTYISICTFILLLATGCQQDEIMQHTTGSEKGIIFTSDYSVTRATNLRDDFQVEDRVGVLGYCRDYEDGRATLPWETKKTACLPSIFYNQELTYTSEGLWTYTYTGNDAIGNMKPWDSNENSQYTFFAYYPYAEMEITTSGWDANDDGEDEEYSGTITGDMGSISLPGWAMSSDTDFKNTGDPEITYTMPFENANGNYPWNQEEYDENTERNYALVPDVMVAATIDHRPADGSVVNLSFEHLLCSIEFRVRNYNTGQNDAVIISSLSLRGSDFYREITKVGTQTPTVNTSETFNGTFKLLSSTLQCAPATTDATTGETIPGESWITDSNGDHVQLLFIPNNGRITSSGQCNLILEDSKGSNQRNIEIGTGISFEPGVRNIFTINYIGNDIILQTTTTDRWEDGGDSDIEFE